MSLARRKTPRRKWRPADTERLIDLRRQGLTWAQIARRLGRAPNTVFYRWHTTQRGAISCRNCGRARVNRPRGLCYRCYYTPGVKDLFPGKYQRCRVADFNGQARLAPQPTSATPGTPAKVAVLEERAARREALWHPEDARGDLS